MERGAEERQGMEELEGIGKVTGILRIHSTYIKLSNRA